MRCNENRKWKTVCDNMTIWPSVQVLVIWCCCSVFWWSLNPTTWHFLGTRTDRPSSMVYGRSISRAMVPVEVCYPSLTPFCTVTDPPPPRHLFRTRPTGSHILLCGGHRLLFLNCPVIIYNIKALLSFFLSRINIYTYRDMLGRDMFTKGHTQTSTL